MNGVLKTENYKKNILSLSFLGKSVIQFLVMGLEINGKDLIKKKEKVVSTLPEDFSSMT